MSEKQRDIEIGKLVLRHLPGYGEQIVLVSPTGEELGTEVVSMDLDGFAVAVRVATANLVRASLPDIEPPSSREVDGFIYRRALVAPAELQRGMLVEIDDTGTILGEVQDRDVIGSLDVIITGSFADGRSFAFPLDTGLWVRIPN